MCPATDREKVHEDGHWRSRKSLVRGTFEPIRDAPQSACITLLIRRLWVRVPPPGAANAQVEDGSWPTVSRPDKMCPAVVPRRFENGSHHVSSRRLFAPLELLVPVTIRVVSSLTNFSSRETRAGRARNERHVSNSAFVLRTTSRCGVRVLAGIVPRTGGAPLGMRRGLLLPPRRQRLLCLVPSGRVRQPSREARLARTRSTQATSGFVPGPSHRRRVTGAAGGISARRR